MPRTSVVSTLKQWRVAFWVCLGVLVFTNVIYVIFAKGEQQWWDDVKKHGYPEGWKHGPLPTKERNTEEANQETKEKEKEKK